MPDRAPLFIVPEPVELPRELDPLVEELAARLLAIGTSHAHDPATYLEPASATRAATADARAILFALRSRLDELAPEVVELRAALREANGRADLALRDCTTMRDARDDLANALVGERRLLGAMRTDGIVADARRRTVANYLRRDADATLDAATFRERMRWAADMLDATDGEGVAL